MAPFSISSALLLLACLLAIIAGGAFGSNTEKSKDDCNCSSYAVSGPSPGLFQHYAFYDFRSLSDLEAPQNITSVLSLPEFQNSFYPQGWSIANGTPIAPVPVDHDVSNIYISQHEGHPHTTLDLRTLRNPTNQSSAELELARRNILHASIRVRARIQPGSAPGAVAGFFTYANLYDDGDSRIDPESDIEILTRDAADTIHYTNQPGLHEVPILAENGSTIFAMDTIPQATSEIQLPDGKTWDTFLTHRLDWFPGMSRFWVGDSLLVNKTHAVPRDPCGLLLNIWSNGGTFSGNMTVGKDAVLSIEYIEIAFNTSGPFDGPRAKASEARLVRRSQALDTQENNRSFWTYWAEKIDRPLWKRGIEEKEGGEENQCQVVCKIDRVKDVGKPERIEDVSDVNDFDENDDVVQNDDDGGDGDGDGQDGEESGDEDKKDGDNEKVESRARHNTVPLSCVHTLTAAIVVAALLLGLLEILLEMILEMILEMFT